MHIPSRLILGCVCQFRPKSKSKCCLNFTRYTDTVVEGKLIPYNPKSVDPYFKYYYDRYKTGIACPQPVSIFHHWQLMVIIKLTKNGDGPVRPDYFLFDMNDL